MKNNYQKIQPTRTANPTQEEIRDYAYHLFEQHGQTAGQDLANWLEAEACLKAHIPVNHSRTRLHGYLQGLGPAMQSELCEISSESRNLAT